MLSTYWTNKYIYIYNIQIYHFKYTIIKQSIVTWIEVKTYYDIL